MAAPPDKDKEEGKENGQEVQAADALQKDLSQKEGEALAEDRDKAKGGAPAAEPLQKENEDGQAVAEDGEAEPKEETFKQLEAREARAAEALALAPQKEDGEAVAEDGDEAKGGAPEPPADPLQKDDEAVAEDRDKAKDVAGAEAGAAAAAAGVETLAGAAPASPTAAASAPPSQARAPQTPPSTVKRFVASSGGAEKALKRYISSFGEHGNQANDLGTRPPTRSYRSLRILPLLLQEFEKKARAIHAKHEVPQITAQMKPYKNAIKDLVTMAKAAVARCESAVQSAKESKDKRTSSPTRPARSFTAHPSAKP